MDVLHQSALPSLCRLVDKGSIMSKMVQYNQMDPRTLRSLDMFYTAFTVLLTDKHYEFISIKDIAVAAKLNRATFYLHFQNKLDFIYFCCHYGYYKEITAELPVDPFQKKSDNLTGFIRWTLLFIQKTYLRWNYQWDEILFEKGTRDAIYDYLHGWLSSHNSNNYSFSQIQVDLMAISSALTGVGMMWCQNGNIEPVDLLTDQILKLFSSGFSWLK